MGGHKLLNRQLSNAPQPLAHQGALPRKHQIFQDRRHAQLPTAADRCEILLPAAAPTKGEAPPHLINSLRLEAGGEQHQAFPTPQAALRAVVHRFTAVVAAVIQQRLGVEIQQLGPAFRHSDQAIGAEQGAAGVMQHGGLTERARPQGQRTELLPMQFVAMGHPIVEQHLGAPCWKAEPTER